MTSENRRRNAAAELERADTCLNQPRTPRFEMIGEHFVHPSRLSTQMGRLVSRMQRDREDADYSTGAVFTTEEAARMIGDAEAFVSEARQIVDSRRG